MCWNADYVVMNRISRFFEDDVPGAMDEAPPIDLAQADEEHKRFGEAIESHCGVPVRYLRINAEKPGGRYIEDAGRVVQLRNGALIYVAMPYGHDARRPERRAALRAAKKHLQPDETIHVPLDLRGDGGDTYFSHAQQTLFVGISGRTTRDLCDYLEGRLRRYGVRVVGINMAKSCLHLITGSSLIADDAVAVHSPSFNNGFRAFSDAGMKVVQTCCRERDGANFFSANGKLIGNEGCPKSVDLVERWLGQPVFRVRYHQSSLRNGSFTCDTLIVPKRFTNA